VPVRSISRIFTDHERRRRQSAAFLRNPIDIGSYPRAHTHVRGKGGQGGIAEIDRRTDEPRRN